MRILLPVVVLILIPFALIFIGDAFYRMGSESGSRIWTAVGSVIARTGAFVVTVALALGISAAAFAVLVYPFG